MAPGVINWTIVLLISIGSLMGGFIGARVGRAMHPNLLRAVIVLIGTVAIINLLVD